ncbi:hypothetical protein D3C85_1622400 [compost metagenome]
MCKAFLPDNRPSGPFFVYLKVLPGIEVASVYAFKTGGIEKFHMGETYTYLSAATY